jgi:hypothetical protein
MSTFFACWMASYSDGKKTLVGDNAVLNFSSKQSTKLSSVGIGAFKTEGLEAVVATRAIAYPGATVSSSLTDSSVFEISARSYPIGKGSTQLLSPATTAPISAAKRHGFQSIEPLEEVLFIASSLRTNTLLASRSWEFLKPSLSIWSFQHARHCELSKFANKIQDVYLETDFDGETAARESEAVVFGLADMQATALRPSEMADLGSSQIRWLGPLLLRTCRSLGAT